MQKTEEKEENDLIRLTKRFYFDYTQIPSVNIKWVNCKQFIFFADDRMIYSIRARKRI